MTAEINQFSVFGEMLTAMGQTGHRQVCTSPLNCGISSDLE